MKSSHKFTVVDGGKSKPRPMPSKPKDSKDQRIGYRTRHPSSLKVSAMDDPHSLATYYVQATDGQGHSAMMGTSVPPSLKRLADMVMTKGKFGFKTPGDLVRWCIRDGLDKLSNISKDPEIQTEYEKILPIIRAQSEELANMQYEKDLATMKHQFDTLLRSGNIGAVDRLLQDIERVVNAGEIPQHWRERWRIMFLDHYKWVEKRKREIEEGID